MSTSASDPLLGHGQQESSKWCWLRPLFMITTIALLAAVLIVTVDNHTKLKDQNDDLSLLKNLFLRKESPTKFALENVGPRKYQGSRGTCWGFGTIACVEYQYRQQGIANGWLAPDQYMFFSEQAYGNRILKFCKEHRMQCLLPGDRVAFNSTNGGEAHLLYVFRKELANALLPHSVCPYLQEDSSYCEDIERKIAENPVKFTMNSFSTFYDIAEIKHQLVAKNRALALSVPIFGTSYYMGCSDEFAKSDKQCADAPAKCVNRCPEGFKDTCCKKIDQPMWNMNGEFKKHRALDPEAGHVMMLVAYNDEYETEDHQHGGFIMRNTWKDGVYALDEFGNVRNRGSHSMQYFMQEISLADEKVICPNSENPRSWYTCGPCEDCDTIQKTANFCAGNDQNDTAAALLQPFFLRCRDDSTGECVKPSVTNPNRRYFTLNMSNYGDDLHIMCFMEVDYDGVNPPVAIRDICATPRPLDVYAKLMVPDQIYPNSEDYCGYYFFPYDLARECNAKLGGFFANDYEMHFDSSSYESNKVTGKDYQYVKSSTFHQSAFPHFATPYPNSQDT